MSDSPFEDLRRVISQLPQPDTCAAKKNASSVTGFSDPGGSDLESLRAWLSVWQGRAEPTVDEAHICVLASSYVGGNADEATDFIAAASKGQATVNRLCVDRGVGLRVLELAPEMPHDLEGDWQQAECMAAVAFGMEATAAGGHLLGVSDIAPGNKEGSLAILASLLPGEASENLSDFSEFSEGVTASELDRAKALLGSKPTSDKTSLDTLLAYGGRETAACVGAIVAARSRRLPVVIDGWSALAAVSVLEAEAPNSTDHVRLASSESELQQMVARKLGKTPLVGTLVNSGPGCGNAISVAILKAACDL